MGLAAFNRMRRLKQATEGEAKIKISLDEMSYPELRALAKEHKIEGYYNMNTEELRAVLKAGE